MSFLSFSYNLFYLIGTISPAMKSPVFIIGSGRCGTGLLVRLLKSHANLVDFPGEANKLWHPNSYPFRYKSIETPSIFENPEKFSELSISNWPTGQIKKIRASFSGFNLVFGTGKQLFSKSAMLSFMIPTILSLFQNAKLIHIYRNGPSVISSLQKKEWPKYTTYFNSKTVFSLACANYWNACMFEIESKVQSLCLKEKGAFYELSYEHLCQRPLDILHELASFLNIDPNGFNFELSSIKSMNFKVGDYSSDPSWKPIVSVIEPALILKGYI